MDPVAPAPSPSPSRVAASSYAMAAVAVFALGCTRVGAHGAEEPTPPEAATAEPAPDELRPERIEPEPTGPEPLDARAARIAAIVDAVREHGVESLRRVSSGVSLVGSRTETVLCEDASGRCFELPRFSRITHFDCDSTPQRRCSLHLEDAGRDETWVVELGGRSARRRRLWSAPTARRNVDPRGRSSSRPLHSERWLPVAPRAERPSALDDPAFDPAVTPGTDASCSAVVASIHRGELVVTSIGCTDPDDFERRTYSEFVAFVVTDGAHSFSGSLADTDLPMPELARFGDAPVLAPGGYAFETVSNDGGSPSGASEETFWIALPVPGGNRMRVFGFVVGAVETFGLGEEREGEGYAVDYRAYAIQLEPVGPMRARVSGCEGWSGTHFRGSDRWEGSGGRVELDLPIVLDPERGFAMSSDDESTLRTRCRTGTEE